MLRVLRLEVSGYNVYIIFRTQNKPVDPAICNVIYNTNEIGLPEDPALITPIERISSENQESSFKLLGVHFNEHLSFKTHIDILSSKLSKSMYCLNQLKNFVDKPSLLKLYYSMIHSNISYGINIYGCANTTNLEKICKKQKQAIRIVCNAPFRAHTGTAPLFKELKILPLDQLIEYSRIKFMHCFHFKKLPPSFNEMWKTNRERNPERLLRNADDLYVPARRVEFVKKLSVIAFPTAWNSASGNKTNPVKHLYLKELKSLVLAAVPL